MFIGKFAGFARMSAPSRRDIPHPSWVLPSSMSVKALGGVIEIDWICRNELLFNNTTHLFNPWNDGKPIKIGRDGQEIEPKVGAELCRLFPEDESIEMTPILRKSKETAKLMRDKGIQVIYKPPKNFNVRASGVGTSVRNNNNGSNHYQRFFGSDRRESGGGIIKHKRSYIGSNRPYKIPHILGSFGSSGFKRSGGGGGGTSGNSSGTSGNSPLRGGPSSGVVSSVLRGNCSDAIVPPWERYVSPTAAAEAYLADYMRTMHGQLPPLPFVPPFAQLPLPTPTATNISPPGQPGSLYEHMPPPVRYFDGPPLPDYPPPQPMRGPPPGFEKSCPSFEDFAAWKHAGLPTGALPPGFSAGISNSNSSSGSNLACTNNVGGLLIGSNNQLYRNNRTSDSNTVNSNRLRERPTSRPDFHHRGPGGSSGSGSLGISAGLSALLSSRNHPVGDRDRHFRNLNDHSARSYRDNRR